MKVLVTGGTGAVGKAAVERLAANGHQVRVIGRRPDMEMPEGATYAQCDVNDFAALRGEMKGMEGVVHLAAIPNPAVGSGHEIFRVNCSGSFNVFEAASMEGIKRVVQASSINAFGYNFGVKTFPLRYFPIDEEHPTVTTDPYSFSKQIIEEIGRYYWRRDGISSISIRLPAVLGKWRMKGGGRFGRMREWVNMTVKAYKDLLAMSPEEQAIQARKAAAAYDAMRETREFEKPFDQRDHPPERNPYMFFRTDFWAVIDDRDSAQAIEKGLLADYTGSHPLFINDKHNVLGIETHKLAEIFYPEVTEWRKQLKADETLVSIDKARDLLGYEPEYHPKDWFSEDAQAEDED